MDVIREVSLYFNAGYPAIVLNSHEEVRMIKNLETAARDAGASLWVCSVTEGMIRVGAGGQGAKGDRLDKTEVVEILDDIMGRKGTTKEWFVLLDFDDWAKDNPLVQRKLRDLVHRLSSTTRRVVFMQPAWKVPLKLEREVTLVDVGLPTIEELGEALDRSTATYTEAIQEARDSGRSVEQYNLPDEFEKANIVEVMRGMTVLEAENALSKSFQQVRSFDLDLVGRERLQIIKKSGIVELWPSPGDLSLVGGHDVLKHWLRIRRRAFTQEARDAGVKVPRGAMFLGPPGTGKSLASKCIAKAWGCPLLRLDFGAVFEGTVGASEQNIRSVISLCEILGFHVLWIDEIDKGMSSPTGKVLSGGEVTKHVIGSFISWLQEKTVPCFVVATCNDVHSVPPELLRAGRFDKLFFVDLPTLRERMEITAILLGRIGLDPKRFDREAFAALTEGYTGAELERVIDEAANVAFDEERPLTTDVLIENVGSITPISRTMAQEIEGLRTWAKGRAVWSSSPDKDSWAGSSAMGQNNRSVAV